MTEFVHKPVQLFGRTNVSGTAVIGVVVDETTGALKVQEIAPSGTTTSENVDIVAQSYKPLIVQLNSGTNVAGTITARGETVDLQQSTPAEDQSLVNALETNSGISGFNGCGWERLKTLNATSGGTIGYRGVLAVGGTIAAHLVGYDGGADERLRTTSASVGGTMASHEGILGVGLFGRVSGTEFRALPQESASPYELQVAVNRSNMTATTLWSSTNTTAGSTNTYSDISVEQYKTKTVGVYVDNASTLLVDVSFSGTTTFYNFQTENVSANTLKTVTFTDAFEYVQVRVVTPTASTMSAWCSGQV